jgi:hypothetical protein
MKSVAYVYAVVGIPIANSYRTYAISTHNPQNKIKENREVSFTADCGNPW